MASRADAPIARSEVPGWIDGAIAVGVATVAIGSTVAAPSPHRLAVGALYLVAIAPFVLDALGVHLPDGVRVAVPLMALFVVQAGGARWGWLSDDIDNQTGILIGLFVVTEAFSVSSLRVALGSLAGFAAIVIGRAMNDEYLYRSVTWWAAAVFCVGMGLLIRALLRTIVQLDAARDQLALDAVQSERRRIARDVHDVVAHSMTVSMLHLTAARMAIQRGDEPAAVESLEEAERAGRASLRDVRTTVGLLRDDTTSAGDAPEPGLDDLDALVASWRQVGMAVTLQRDGEVREAIGDVAGLALYRIVQEGLANAARHLPAASNRVVITRRERSVDVAVNSVGAVPGPQAVGHGLVGMRERVEALGGTVDAGPRTDGWQVLATLPIDEPSVGTAVR